MAPTTPRSARSLGACREIKTMKRYKSEDGMKNGTALTQWLYRREDEHDLAEEMAA